MVNSVPCHGSSTLEPGLLHDGGSKPRFESSSQITVRLSGFWSTRMQRRCLVAGFLCLTRLLKGPILCLRQAIIRLQYSTLSASPAVTRPQALSAHSFECVVARPLQFARTAGTDVYTWAKFGTVIANCKIPAVKVVQMRCRGRWR